MCKTCKAANETFECDCGGFVDNEGECVQCHAFHPEILARYDQIFTAFEAHLPECSNA